MSHSSLIHALIHTITYHKIILVFFFRNLEEILDECGRIVSTKLVCAMTNAQENIKNLYILLTDLEKLEKTRDEVNKTISFAFLFYLMLLVLILNAIL